MFDWFWDRVTDRMMDSLIALSTDKDFWEKTNPVLDAIIDRQIQRLQGKAGGLAKAAMPKFDLNSLIGMFAQRFLMGNQPQQQEINSSLPTRLPGDI